MKKAQAVQVKIVPLVEKVLAFVQGGSGYVDSAGREAPPPTDPDPSTTGGT